MLNGGLYTHATHRDTETFTYLFIYLCLFTYLLQTSYTVTHDTQKAETSAKIIFKA